VPYLSASAVVIHYEEALYQVYAPLLLPLLAFLLLGDTLKRGTSRQQPVSVRLSVTRRVLQQNC